MPRTCSSSVTLAPPERHVTGALPSAPASPRMAVSVTSAAPEMFTEVS